MGTKKLLNGALDTEILNPPTQERYPCLKHFWKMQDAPGEEGTIGGNLRYVVDSIAGVNFVNTNDGIGVFFVAGDGIKMASLSGSGSSIIPFASYEDKNTVLMYLATRAAASAIAISGIAVNNLASSGFDDSVNTINKDTINLTTGTDQMIVASLDISAAGATGVELAHVDAASYTAETLVKSGVSADVDMSNYTGSALSADAEHSDIYGIAVFQFTDMPSYTELSTGSLWMRERWLVGEKVIWPGYLNRN